MSGSGIAVAAPVGFEIDDDVSVDEEVTVEDGRKLLDDDEVGRVEEVL